MTKPKSKRSKRRRGNNDVFYQEEHEAARKLASRYAKKRGSQTDRNTPAIEKSTGRVLNPVKHDPTLQRALQGHLSKLNSPEEPPKFVARHWVCALCGLQSCQGILGDLYGPYFVTGLGSSYPDYLPVATRKKSTKQSKVDFHARDPDVSSDIWFHGNCALWTPDLIMFGGRFPRLSEVLQKCWKEKCRLCKKFGASVPVNSANTAFVHFPCAQAKVFDVLISDQEYLVQPVLDVNTRIEHICRIPNDRIDFNLQTPTPRTEARGLTAT